MSDHHSSVFNSDKQQGARQSVDNIYSALFHYSGKSHTEFGHKIAPYSSFPVLTVQSIKVIT